MSLSLRGVPRSVIFDITKKFDVEVVERKQVPSSPTWTATSGNSWLSAPGREVAEQVEKYMIEIVCAFIGE